ncbi:MAG: KH domain-containing protein [Candidatus Micrarchaeaceae archaeon]
MKRIVMPGEKIPGDVKQGMAYAEHGSLFATVLGLYDEESKRLIPLEGTWSPKLDETVVGIIESVGRNNTYTVDLNSFRIGVLLLGKFSKAEFKIGDVIEALVDRVNGKKEVILSNPRLLKEGTIVKIKPTKIPRVLGKANTMAKQISELTRCDMVVGSNGIVWLRGENTALAIAALLQIERDAHVSGLTEKIKEMLISNSTKRS